ncbi:hypothetical protein TELCIR_15475 [Teladorsagia circumcincta]|uniref:Sphingomyelin phosphodiesterase C-terminal domain-containing protein n=1 Tax=Teladorsagia circumcincta TaxID=45464 RepID=A0A2G9TYC2_TELCI|nr:hypothetical protein TELCIR_15475 [Teladorsagia circumcincta]
MSLVTTIAFKDSNGSSVQFALMTPAVTPWFSSLEGAGANNPAFRIYFTDDNGVINDFETYYVNLTALNNDGNETQFVKEYSFKEVYGITGTINVEAMDGIVDRLKNDTEFFQKYIEYNSVLWDPKLPEGRFRDAQLCSIEFADYPRYYACMGHHGSSAYSHRILAPIVLIFSFFRILW